MKFDDQVPIYLQIKQVIYREMVTGKLAPGAQLPAVRQLALDLTVNVNTVQRALSTMITEGVLISKRGRGNFVTADTEKIAALKQQLVQTQLTTTYEELHALSLTDDEIVTSVQQYVRQRREKDDNDVSD